MEKLDIRMTNAEDLLDIFRNAEEEIQRNAESQREVVNSEMDHLRELIETKRSQLLSKCAMEEKQKRLQLQTQIGRAEAARTEVKALVGRSEHLLSLDSEHAFLAVVLPLIQDMKKCESRPVDSNQRVSTSFRPISTDAQVRSLGELELGHPRVQQHSAQPVFAGPGVHLSQHGAMESHRGAFVTHQQQSYHGSSAAYILTSSHTFLL